MKKYIIFLLVVIQIFTLTIPVNADNVKNCYTHERIYIDTTVIPMYIPHPCHSGISHALCEWEAYDLIQCGCRTIIWYCCCGLKMRSAFIPCNDHGI